MDKIKIAIVGAGNGASSLIQGIHYYRDRKPENTIGLLQWKIGGYGPGDIEIVAAFDIDKQKVGKDINKAIFSRPTYLPDAGISIQMGRILSGDSDIIKNSTDKETFVLADYPGPTREEIVNTLKETGTEIIMNYIPASSEDAATFYAYCALDAGVSFVNNSSVCIASNMLWALRFEYKNIPIIGDNVKSKFPSRDTLKSAGIAIDSIRCAKLALNRGLGGVLLEPSAYFCERPYSIYEEKIFNMIEQFINDEEGFCVDEIPGYGIRNRRMTLE